MSDPANILINDRCFLRPATGVAVYLRNILDHWPADAALKPRLYLNRQRPARKQERQPLQAPRLVPLTELRPPPLKLRFRPWWARKIVDAARRKFFTQRFRRGPFRLYFEPNHLAINCRTAGKHIVTTIHDLSVLERPHWHPADRVRQWQLSLNECIEATDHWITVSEFTASRMRNLLAIDPAKITVIPSAARPMEYPTADEVQVLRDAGALPRQYCLHVGTLEPRKNLPMLLDAYGQLSTADQQACPLVLAGGAGWGDERFWRQLAEHSRAANAYWAGYVTDRQAGLLMAGARVLLSPSNYEGFGLPLLEAFDCGTPVICSDIPAFVQTAGTAAHFVPPDDTAQWTRAISRIIHDKTWYESLARLGKLRAGEFSWAASAKAHAEVMQRVAGL